MPKFNIYFQKTLALKVDATSRQEAEQAAQTACKELDETDGTKWETNKWSYFLSEDKEKREAEYEVRDGEIVRKEN